MFAKSTQDMSFSVKAINTDTTREVRVYDGGQRQG